MASYLDRRSWQGRAVSGFEPRSHCVFPALQSRAPLLPWARDSHSSCSGTPTPPHRSWSTESTLTTHTSRLTLERHSGVQSLELRPFPDTYTFSTERNKDFLLVRKSWHLIFLIWLGVCYQMYIQRLAAGLTHLGRGIWCSWASHPHRCWKEEEIYRFLSLFTISDWCSVSA